MICTYFWSIFTLGHLSEFWVYNMLEMQLLITNIWTKALHPQKLTIWGNFPYYHHHHHHHHRHLHHHYHHLHHHHGTISKSIWIHVPKEKQQCKAWNLLRTYFLMWHLQHLHKAHQKFRKSFLGFFCLFVFFRED